MSIDYDTLVSRLRSEAHECGLLDEAADAIEALRAEIAHLEEALDSAGERLMGEDI